MALEKGVWVILYKKSQTGFAVNRTNIGDSKNGKWQTEEYTLNSVNQLICNQSFGDLISISPRPASILTFTVRVLNKIKIAILICPYPKYIEKR